MRLQDAHELIDLLWPKVIQIDGLFLLASQVPERGVKLSDFVDRTGAEAFYNHVHILDHFDHNVELDGADSDRRLFDADHPDFIGACELGRVVASTWRAKLMSEYPGQLFRIYYTAEDNPIIRFHLVRPGEAVWLDEAQWGTQIANGQVAVLTTKVDL